MVPRDRSTSSIYLAVVFGCLYLSVLLALEPYVSLLAWPMVATVRSIGVAEVATFKTINVGFWAVVYFVVSGLAFGLPLGLFSRSHWLRVWLVFVIAAVGTGLAFALAGEYGPSEFLSDWHLPGQWGLAGFLSQWGSPHGWTNMAGVALFAWLGSRLVHQNRLAP